MCGRFAVNKQQVENWLTANLLAGFQCNENLDLRPSQEVSTLIKSDDTLCQQNSLWGIKPAWAKKLIINAQAETVAQKPTFKQAFKQQRCIIPCSSWFEWQSDAAGKKCKYQFKLEQQTPLFMAGIYYQAQDYGLPLLVTLTSKPTNDCAPYHQRMPLLVKPEKINDWLSKDQSLVVPLLSTAEQKFQILAC